MKNRGEIEAGLANAASGQGAAPRETNGHAGPLLLHQTDSCADAIAELADGQRTPVGEDVGCDARRSVCDRDGRFEFTEPIA